MVVSGADGNEGGGIGEVVEGDGVVGAAVGSGRYDAAGGGEIVCGVVGGGGGGLADDGEVCGDDWLLGVVGFVKFKGSSAVLGEDKVLEYCVADFFPKYSDFAVSVNNVVVEFVLD